MCRCTPTKRTPFCGKPGCEPPPQKSKPSAEKAWPSDQVEKRPIEGLIPYARNARTHSDAQIAQIAASIREWGWTNPVLVAEDGTIIAGHGRVLAARQLGITEVPVMVARGWTEAQKRAYVIADNQLGLNAGWDMELLKVEMAELQGLDFNLDLIGFDDKMLAAIEATGAGIGLTDPDAVPEAPLLRVSRIGDVWTLGRHRLACLSSSDESTHSFFGKPDLVLTDPPYCSGGFQESQRSQGSVGTDAKHKQIANDRLSSRGFQSLIKAGVFAIPAQYFYIFTDWRMWVYLFDAAESSSAGVRSMITWNKGTPGMGMGWRAQHELIMWATRQAPPYAKGFPGIGNVISLPRQANELHTTQKPTELLRILLQGAPFARTVADPFVGSGTTIIACEMEGRDCLACELDPFYVDVALLRWQEFTGEEATLDGTPYFEVKESREKTSAEVA
jgi:DNA modification methylase